MTKWQKREPSVLTTCTTYPFPGLQPPCRNDPILRFMICIGMDRRSGVTPWDLTGSHTHTPHCCAQAHTRPEQRDCGSNDLCCLQSFLQRRGFMPEVCLLCCAGSLGCGGRAYTRKRRQGAEEEGTQQSRGGRARFHGCSAGALQLCPP